MHSAVSFSPLESGRYISTKGFFACQSDFFQALPQLVLWLQMGSDMKEALDVGRDECKILFALFIGDCGDVVGSSNGAFS